MNDGVLILDKPAGISSAKALNSPAELSRLTDPLSFCFTPGSVAAAVAAPSCFGWLLADFILSWSIRLFRWSFGPSLSPAFTGLLHYYDLC